jgi:lysophospholipase L1-like esterase
MKQSQVALPLDNHSVISAIEFPTLVSLGSEFTMRLAFLALFLALLLALLLALTPTVVLAQATNDSALPSVLLVGDSIRLGYAPLVAKKLEGIAIVHSPKPNAADTTTTLKTIDTWLANAKPTIVHWNNGLHDLKFGKATKQYQVPLDQYRKQLQAIHAKIVAVTPHVVFATTTPIIDDRHAARKADFDRRDADVKLFNIAARDTLLPLNVPIHDLNRIVDEGDAAKMLGKDGTHYTAAGYDRLADAVVDVIKRQLAVLNPTRLKAPASGADAVAAYQKAEAAQDALVPDEIKKLPFPQFDIPTRAEAWAARRAEVKAKVIASLGDMPPRAAKPVAHLVSVEQRKGFRIERFRIPNGVDGTMSAMMLIPDGLKGPAPTILWLHSSSFNHTQLLVPNTNGGQEPLGLAFVKRGWVVFAPDAAWYGDRAGAGPSGSSETTANQQSSQLKLNLWFGRTLWGMFLRDDQVALDYLYTRPEVDKKRIGATGISMGSTRSWWLAAVDDRITAVVGVACLTRYENLIKHGQLRQHGVYYFVNGLLQHFDTEGVIALIAPRPTLFLTGELDAGSPVDGIRVIEEKVGGVYAAVGAKERFRSMRYADIGHTYTPAMRIEMLAWFDRWLK